MGRQSPDLAIRLATDEALTIMSDHIYKICPSAPVWVLNELFASAEDSNATLNKILREHQITDSRVVAMFVAIAIYDTAGLTKFRAPNDVEQSPAEWLSDRGRWWEGLKLNKGIIDGSKSFFQVTDAVCLGTANFPERRRLYDLARKIFGMKVQVTEDDIEC